jgi:hypothetical protein
VHGWRPRQLFENFLRAVVFGRHELHQIDESSVGCFEEGPPKTRYLVRRALRPSYADFKQTTEGLDRSPLSVVERCPPQVMLDHGPDVFRKSPLSEEIDHSSAVRRLVELVELI